MVLGNALYDVALSKYNILEPFVSKYIDDATQYLFKEYYYPSAELKNKTIDELSALDITFTNDFFKSIYNESTGKNNDNKNIKVTESMINSDLRYRKNCQRISDAKLMDRETIFPEIIQETKPIENKFNKEIVPVSQDKPSRLASIISFVNNNQKMIIGLGALVAIGYLLLHDWSDDEQPKKDKKLSL